MMDQDARHAFSCSRLLICARGTFLLQFNWAIDATGSGRQALICDSMGKMSSFIAHTCNDQNDAAHNEGDSQ